MENVSSMPQKPLPDFEKLKSKTAEFALKVGQFYGGQHAAQPIKEKVSVFKVGNIFTQTTKRKSIVVLL